MNRERLARAGLFSLLGGATGAVAGLLLAMVVGRGLGPQGTGLFFQLIALFLILANVLELGADTGLVREMSRQRSVGRFADLRRTAVIAVLPVAVVGVLASVLLWLMAPWMASLLAEPADVSTMEALIRSTAPFVLVASLLTVLLGGTRGLGGVAPFVSVYNVGVPVARVLLVLAAMGAGFGVSTVTQVWAWPFVLATGIAAVVLLRQLSGTLARSAGSGQPATPTRQLMREFWSFSAPRGLGAALEIALAWIDVLLVGALLGPVEAGVYAVASRAVRAGLLVDTAMRTAVSPGISAALARGDLIRARDLQLGATRALILLSWPLYVTLACFAPVVLEVFGTGFDAGAGTVLVLCVAMMLLSAAGMVQTVLLMGGRSRWQMNNKAVALAVNLTGNVVLLPAMGIAGAGVAWLLTVAVDTALAGWQVHRLMAVRFAARPLVLPGAIVAGTVVVPGLLFRVTLGASGTALAAHLVVAGVLFAVACWRFRTHLGLTGLTAMLRARTVPA